MKYIEFGVGNRWLVRTEFEHEDGTETEQKGIHRPIYFHSIYLRVWIGVNVLIIDLRNGFRLKKKSRKAFKCVFGISSYSQKREKFKRI